MFDCSILVEDEGFLVSSDRDGGWWEGAFPYAPTCREYKRKKPSEAAIEILLL